MSLNIIQADLSNDNHANVLIELLNSYAMDPAGGGEPLNKYTQDNLIDQLSKTPNHLSFIAFSDDQPAGLAICFEGFSTFACKPLINIHDFIVTSNFRCKGIGKALIEAIQQEAQQRGCCKITLEVLENNHHAISLYKKCGFVGYELSEDMGKAMFMEMKI